MTSDHPASADQSPRGDQNVAATFVEAASADAQAPVALTICVDLSLKPELAEVFVRSVAAQNLGLAKLAAIVADASASHLSQILARAGVAHSLYVADGPSDIAGKLNYLAGCCAAGGWNVLFCDPSFAPRPEFSEAALHYAALYSPEYLFFNLDMPGATRLPYGLVTKSQMKLWGPLSPVVGFRGSRRLAEAETNAEISRLGAFGSAAPSFGPATIAETWIGPEYRSALWRHICEADDDSIGIAPYACLVTGPPVANVLTPEQWQSISDKLRWAYRAISLPPCFDDAMAFRTRPLDGARVVKSAQGVDFLRDRTLLSALARETDERSLNPFADEASMSAPAPAQPIALAGWRQRLYALLRRLGVNTPTAAAIAEPDILGKCELFDPDFYLADNPDVAGSDYDPRDHYLRHGMAENRRPGPYFEAKNYLVRYPDVEASGLDAMRHYLKQGGAEGRIAPTWRWVMNERGIVLAGRTLSLAADARLDRCIDVTVAAALETKRQAQARPGVLACIPYMTPGNLTLRLLDQIFRNGVECFLSVHYPAAVGGYQEDDGPWSRRPERVFRLYELVSPDGEFDFLAHLIKTRRIETLLVVGASEVYPLLPRLRDRFPGLKIVDQIFNPIGHTRRLLTFADYFDKIIVENSEMVTFFRDRDIEPSKIQEIRSGTDLAHFNAAAADFPRLDLAFGPNVKTIIGYVGRMSPEKDPAGFVAIAKLIAAVDPTVGFLIAGGGALLDDIRASAIHSLPSEQLACVGFVADVRSAFQAIDLLILPSLIDGRPGAIMEANAMGVPVIATRVGGIPDMIEPGVNGMMFRSGAYADAAAIILDLVNSPGRLAEMKHTSARLAAEHFDQEKMFLEYRTALAPSEQPPGAVRRD